MALDRYAYVYNNPLRYNDPTGHFTNEQLEEYYGEYWRKEIQKYSPEMQNVLLDADVQLGTMIIFTKDGEEQQGIMIENENGEIIYWNVENKETMEIGEVNEYEIKGCYFQESKNQYEYTKKWDFSGNGNMESNIILPEHWNYGEEGFVIITKSYSFNKPSALGWTGMGFGTIQVVRAATTGDVSAGLEGLIGLAIGIAEMVETTPLLVLETDKSQTYYGYPPIPTPWGPSSPEPWGP
jgi:hypothetical protein